MPYEVFKNKHTRSTDSTVTIGHRGTLNLSRAAHELLGGPAAVELLYDRDAKLVGLRPASDGSVDAYKVRENGGRSFAVSGAAFVRHYDIPTSSEGACRRPAVLDGDGVLCVDLNEPGVIVASNRTKRGSDLS